VLEVKDLRVHYGTVEAVKGVSFEISEGAIVSLIGANGAGKTTCLRALTGLVKPSGGEVRFENTSLVGLAPHQIVRLGIDRNETDGRRVNCHPLQRSRDLGDFGRAIEARMQIGGEYIGTLRKAFPEDQPVHFAIQRTLSRNARRQASSWGNSPHEVDKKAIDYAQHKACETPTAAECFQPPIAAVDQGDTNFLVRVAAHVLVGWPREMPPDQLKNVALEEALENFAGCAVIISHDRWFLDRIATHILAFEGDSHVTWFEGNYSDYETDRHARLGTAADQPHRIKYRHLTR